MSEENLREYFIGKLFDYICENNPDLLVLLEEDIAIGCFLTDKVDGIMDTIREHAGEPLYALEERCMELLTKDLRPSKYNYIMHVLEQEFGPTHNIMQESGVLKFEVINLVSYCDHLFEAMHFSEANEDNQLLFYGVAGAISQYLDLPLGEGERSEQWGTTVIRG
jgi:hypothetical protein